MRYSPHTIMKCSMGNSLKISEVFVQKIQKIYEQLKQKDVQEKQSKEQGSENIFATLLKKREEKTKEEIPVLQEVEEIPVLQEIEESLQKIERTPKKEETKTIEKDQQTALKPEDIIIKTQEKIPDTEIKSQETTSEIKETKSEEIIPAQEVKPEKIILTQETEKEIIPVKDTEPKESIAPLQASPSKLESKIDQAISLQKEEKTIHKPKISEVKLVESITMKKGTDHSSFVKIKPKKAQPSKVFQFLFHPAVRENILLFVGIFLIVAGEIFVVSNTWNRMSGEMKLVGIYGLILSSVLLFSTWKLF